MKKVSMIVELKRVAKKAGGDRYEGITHNGEEFVVYFPQSISRQDNDQPTQTLQVNVEEVE